MLSSVLYSGSLRCARLLSGHATSLFRAAQGLPSAFCQVPGGWCTGSTGSGAGCSASSRTLHSAPLPPNNNTSSFRGFASKPVVNLPPSSFESAFRDLGRHAADPSCPTHVKQVLERVNATLGGRWLMVHCGDLLSAPRPAYALVHVAFGLVAQGQHRVVAHTVSHTAQGAGLDEFDKALSCAHRPGSTSARAPSVGPQVIDYRPQPIPSQQLDPTCTQLFYPAVYELEERGWPTGRLYNSATDFELRTTLAANKKTDQSFRLVSGGTTLGKWLSVALGHHSPFPCEKPGKNRVWACRHRYNQLVKAAGVDVMDKEDAPKRSLTHKEQKGCGENGAPQGIYSSDTPPSLLPEQHRPSKVV